ncbi:helix-turn-helix domain-containing protein [Microbispora sp. CA-135349]|uniref:helix-turn-helix domain-containing protein n=1 Tax=Microbispora sp. CA-135349 TaxID=3239953 RepID=UPI003D94459A
MVALVAPNQELYPVTSASAVFGYHGPDIPQRYSFSLCAEHPRSLPTTLGVPIQVDSGLEALDDADTVVIASWTLTPSPAVLHAVSQAHARGARIVAVCAESSSPPPWASWTQYPPLPTTGPMPDSLAPLLEWLLSRLSDQVTVKDMAAYSGVSPRTLTRQFADQLGVPPARWLLERRLAATRALLEETDLPVETIATRVGLSSAVNLRRRFHTALRTTPAAYRRSFH